MHACVCACCVCACVSACVCELVSNVLQMTYRNLVIFRVENISYVIISCSFNFVRSPYHI